MSRGIQVDAFQLPDPQAGRLVAQRGAQAVADACQLTQFQADVADRERLVWGSSFGGRWWRGGGWRTAAAGVGVGVGVGPGPATVGRPSRLAISMAVTMKRPINRTAQKAVCRAGRNRGEGPEKMRIWGGLKFSGMSSPLRTGSAGGPVRWALAQTARERRGYQPDRTKGDPRRPFVRYRFDAATGAYPDHAPDERHVRFHSWPTSVSGRVSGQGISSGSTRCWRSLRNAR